MTRRLAPVLAGIAGVGIVLPFVVGAGPGAVAFTVPAFVALGLVALVGSRRAAAVEPGWTAPRRLEGPQAPPAPAGPDPPTGPPARKVAAALSRFEAHELTLNPWFGVGIGLLVVSFLLLTGVYGADNGEHWADVVGLAPWLAHPLVGMMVLAAHRGVTRARRDGADELFDTCPANPTTRTLGALGAAWVPVLALVVFFVAYGITSAVRSPNLYGAPGADAIPVLLGALVLGVGGVALGVALGRWVPFALAPVAVVVAVGFVSLRLATAGDPGWNPLQQLSSVPPLGDGSPAFNDAPAWSHLGWLVALTSAVLVIAVVRHRRDRGVAVVAAVTLLILPVTGIAATRAMPGPAARGIADRIARPADHQRCRSAGAIQVCVYDGHEELGDRAVAELAPVAAMLPLRAAPITLRQRFGGTTADLPPEVARLLPDGPPAPPVGEVALELSASPDALFRNRSLLALAAVDLPVAARPDAAPLVVAGQARGIVALWLSTRGLGPAATRRLTSSRTADEHDCRDWPVAWSSQDLRAARALIALPEVTVRDAVHGAWEHWQDRATGTAELLGAVGLPAAGPFPADADGSENPC
ncbi:MAG: hypothetical protein ABIS47_01420 [Acidimicrobiales bacterium]